MEKCALITGGTKGIGKAVALCLGKAGYNLVLTYASDPGMAEQTREGLQQQFGINVSVLQADITKKESIDKIDAYLQEKSLLLDALIFNAGLTCRDSFEDLSLTDWERVFFANVHFPVFLLQRIVGRINKGGSVVFTGSLMGIQPHSVSLAYGVTKSAVHALVKNMVKFLVPYELRVNAVAPGIIKTERFEELYEANGDKIDNRISRIALGRLGTPQDVANAVSFLASDRASYISGHILGVDGCASI